MGGAGGARGGGGRRRAEREELIQFQEFDLTGDKDAPCVCVCVRVCRCVSVCAGVCRWRARGCVTDRGAPSPPIQTDE